MQALLNILHDLVFDYTLRTVALGASTLGAVSGALGTYAVLRKQSLLGDAMSHAALPGVVLAFMLTGSKASLVLILGAAIAGWLGTLVIMAMVRNTRISEDSAMGLVLSVFFGLGLMLLTIVQRTPQANKAGLDKFLFGQAATLLQRDVITMAVLGGTAIILVLVFWKEFKLLSFNEEFGTTMGFPMEKIDVLLTTLIVIAIVIGLQAVGVVLMSAMIVAPAAAARQWTNKMGTMVVLSAIFGALSGLTGTVISSFSSGLSTGPTIVLSSTVIVAISFIFAPNRGILWRLLESNGNRNSLMLEAILMDLYKLAQKHGDRTYPHSAAALQVLHGNPRRIKRSIKSLERSGWLESTNHTKWSLTKKGWAEAQRIEALREGE